MKDRVIRIVDNNKAINIFYCKTCKKGTSAIIKVGKETYCDSCLPEKYKDKIENYNQIRERID